MSDKFVRFIAYFSVAVAVFLGIILTVIGGLAEGWKGVGIMLAGQALFIVLLYMYNRKYK